MSVPIRRQSLRALQCHPRFLQPQLGLQSQSHSTRCSAAAAAFSDTTSSEHNTSSPSTALVVSTSILEVPKKAKEQPRWIPSDDEKLWTALSEHLSTWKNANLVDWQAISQSLELSRKPSALRARYNNAMATSSSRRRLGFIFQELRGDTGSSSLGGPRTGVRWSPEEDDALRTGVAIYGEGKWVLVSEFVGTRTNLQCSSRWRCLSSPLSGEVTPVLHWARVMQRESKLKVLLSAGDLSNSELSRRSAVVSAILKHQQLDAPSSVSSERLRVATAKVDQLDGRALLEPFSPEEDEMIVRLVRLYGNQWSRIASLISAGASACLNRRGQSRNMQRRTALGVKTRFMALVRPHHNLPPEVPQTKVRTPGHAVNTDKRALRAWTAKEDAELEAVVGSMVRDKAGFMSWTEVARRLSTDRTSAQCRVRWTQHISTHIQHTPFTKAEDKLLWPFVIDAEQRPLASKGHAAYRGKTITVKYASARGAVADVGIGWLGAGLMAGRATTALRLRVGRLQHVIEWMRKVAGIKDAHLHFDIVHRLANTPSDFRIQSKRRSK
ncbi:hypothetical protein GGI00_001147 [Coemansia sp. RSA 2681]|nr:hypothetical protein GGI00_001147 [Coemansia sp. RSA 2681]